MTNTAGARTHVRQAPSEIDIAAVATVIGEPHRARILMVLLDGRPHIASDIAAAIGISASAATAHLHRLIDAGLVRVQRTGRFRRHTLAGPDVARLVEAMAALAPRAEIRSLAQSTAAQAHRDARSCYDHLAGKLGVQITEGLRDAGAINYEPSGAARPAGSVDTPVALGSAAQQVFAGLDVDVAALTAGAGRRPLLRLCVDWSERAPHLAGTVGAAVLTSLLDQHWVTRRGSGRALTLTPTGARRLQTILPDQHA